MTHDRRLKTAAEACCLFIMTAQDPKGGGWRYIPQQPGDTSVVGWQLMGLKSAQAANIRIASRVFVDVNRFLDSVAGKGGATYGYVKPGDRGQASACTAIGLLCRMYLGWKRDHQGLEAGIKVLAKAGPSNDMYYNYYATQVLHHWGGPEWTSWNEKMRGRLVTLQVQSGLAAGSWKPSGGHHAGPGGRLFETCLSVMTLEVYYRHLPLYERANIQV